MRVALVGAGGHAKALVEALLAQGHRIEVYVDLLESDWLDARRVTSDRDLSDTRLAVIIGFGGTTPSALVKRLAVLRRYLARGFEAPAVVHPAATVSRSARLGAGVCIIAGAVIQPATNLGMGVIVNTNAVVDHDSAVAEGSHVAPGAVVLGGCKVGGCAMIGAGAVVLQGASVPDRTLVRAASLWRRKSVKKRRS